ncbi:unnamed protein product, partial [Rotaria magnacalcarata]
DDPACNKQRTYANVASASTTPLITPRIDVQVTRETPVVNKTQLKIKTCYRCKQPGHVQKDCIFNHNGVVHHSTPIPDDVGYLRSGFEYFQIRFANSSDQKEPTSDQDRSRRALSNALI